MLDFRNKADVWDAVRASAYAGGIIFGIIAVTHIYPFNNAITLLVLSSAVVIGALWIRIAPPRKTSDDGRRE